MYSAVIKNGCEIPALNGCVFFLWENHLPMGHFPLPSLIATEYVLLPLILFLEALQE